VNEELDKAEKLKIDKAKRKAKETKDISGREARRAARIEKAVLSAHLAVGGV